MYKKDYQISPKHRDLTVTYSEIKWIMDTCPEKNQKLIAYAMLIHSKRHANKQGVFFMTFKDIEETTGVVEMTAINQVNKLIKLEVIECVERNRIPKGKGLLKNLPNLYRINHVESDDNNKEIFTTDDGGNFNVCLRFYFSDKELRKSLSQRQYKSLLG